MLLKEITCTINGLKKILGMKVSIAVIKLVLRTNKVLADGSHPIMLRVSFNGMKEKSTGYSCLPKFWDKKNQCVKKGYPNFLTINAELKKQKDEAIAKRDKYIASDEVYTPAMILAKEEVKNVVRNDVKGLIEAYLGEKGVSPRVVTKWWSVYNSLMKFYGKQLLVNEINEAFCRKYAKWLKDNGVSNGSIRTYLSIIGALCHYAIDLGIMSKYPFESWKYNRTYAESKNELYVHSKSMDVLIEMLMKRLIIRKKGGWTYKEGAVEELLDVKSKLYVLYLYVLGFYMCGLAPVDITLLKRKDIKVVEINGKMYYAIDGHRQKTGQSYRIRLLKDCLMSNVLINTMLMFNDKGDYFLPTLCVYGSKSDIKARIGHIYGKYSETLVEWFKRANEEIARKNVEGDNIPLIDLECRFYSYRHSYIMSEIQKPNANLLRLATLTGKAVTTLHQYVTLLDELDLV